ncbi:alpha/beta hydrolase [Streptomyces sp. RKND-216]|uniref:alpha/beta hydrolase n=1 Tax=Streptomyces sp. RKND-216 TaxID=2562581 RepID=UPI00109D9156|nr:alpha/beta hydrolase [Streptomyces sp. RKND-216]THA26339.1 alpha/beta hydrolase [Streptomyces sp. RKND-216]
MGHGYLVSAVIDGCFALFALVPIRRPLPLSGVGYYFGLVFNELPFVACWLIAASALPRAVRGDLDTPAEWVAFGVAMLAALGFVVVAVRALPAPGAVREALADGLGEEWRRSLPPGAAALRRRTPWARIALWPFPFLGRGWRVQRIADVAYGPAGRQNTLDLYRRRGVTSDAPVFVYLHGGRFVSGRKNREALPLLHRLARQGWVCVSANYRLSPPAVWPDHLVDVKKVLAWVRRHGAEFGADPSTVFVGGSSAGGHLAACAGLTPNDPAYQPGFESADTSVTAVVSLYGWYGNVNAGERVPSSPHGVLREDAPPFFVTHGDKDPLVHVDGARQFVRRLREVSRSPVVYAELPGAHHAYDLFHSIRSEAVVDGVEAFAAWVRATSATRTD